MGHCRICGGSAFERIHSGMRDFFQETAETEDYGRCLGCGLFQAESTREDLGALYGGYGVHQPRSRFFRRVRQFVLRGGYDFPRAPYRGAALLDVGCGDGSYLAAMRARGWSVFGVEVTAAQSAAVAAELGAPVRTAGDDLSDWQSRFDFVTLNFVLEHLERPRPMLAALFPLLRPGGTLFASLPNIESREARLFGSRWFDLDPPRHRSFFTRAQLRGLFRDAGFPEPRFATAGIAPSFAGSVNKLVFRRFRPRVTAALLPAGELWSHLVRDGCLKVWAQRPRG